MTITQLKNHVSWLRRLCPGRRSQGSVQYRGEASRNSTSGRLRRRTTASRKSATRSPMLEPTERKTFAIGALVPALSTQHSPQGCALQLERSTQHSPQGCALQLERSTQHSPQGCALQLERSTQHSPQGCALQLERSTQHSPQGCALQLERSTQHSPQGFALQLERSTQHSPQGFALQLELPRRRTSSTPGMPWSPSMGGVSFRTRTRTSVQGNSPRRMPASLPASRSSRLTRSFVHSSTIRAATSP